MKTTNIRYATLLLAAVMSLNMSAQKNVLKAFEKFKNSRVVAITNTVREQGKTSTSDPWRCNIMEFRFFKGDGVLSRMKELQDAFEQDSQDKDVTYYGQMKGLPENASEADKAKYKKTVVRYNDQDDPIVIGENTTYNVLVLRSNSKDHPGNRIVVATEWKVDDHSSYCIGKLYEIEGPKDFVKPAYDIVVESADTAVVDSMYWEESFTTRMTFYRDNFTLMYNPKNTALMTDMWNYLNTIKWGGSQEIQMGVGQSITLLTPIAVVRYIGALNSDLVVWNPNIVDSIISPEGEILSQRYPTQFNVLESAKPLNSNREIADIVILPVLVFNTEHYKTNPELAKDNYEDYLSFIILYLLVRSYPSE